MNKASGANHGVLKQVSFHNFNNALNGGQAFFKKLKNGLCLDNPRLVDRYMEFELHLIVRFRIDGINEEFVALLKWAEFISRPEEGVQHRDIIGPFRVIGSNLIDECPGHMGPKVQGGKSTPNSNQEAVLVNAVKLMNSPEDVTVPPLVWLNIIDGLNSRLSYSLYFSLATGRVLQGTVENGKVEVGPRADVAADSPKLVNNVVEGTSQVLYGIPRSGGDGIWHGPNPLDIIDQLARLGITLSPNYIWVGVKERPKFKLNLLDMELGPFSFYSGTSEIFCHSSTQGGISDEQHDEE